MVELIGTTLRSLKFGKDGMEVQVEMVQRN